MVIEIKENEFIRGIKVSRIRYGIEILAEIDFGIILLVGNPNW